MHLNTQLKCILFGSFRNSLYLCKQKIKQEDNKNNNNHFSPSASRLSDENMTTKNFIATRNKVDDVYELINDLVSNHSIDMLDLAYPKHDGKQDAGAVAEMMLLRQSANSLSEVCSILVGKLTDAIGDENEVKQ